MLKSIYIRIHISSTVLELMCIGFGDGNFFRWDGILRDPIWDGIGTYFCPIKKFRDGSGIFFYPNYICGTGVGLTNSVPSRLIAD